MSPAARFMPPILFSPTATSFCHSDVVGIALEQAARNRERLVEGVCWRRRYRRSQALELRDVVEADRDVARPFGVLRVEAREPAADIERLLIRGERVRVRAGARVHSRDVVESRGEVGLPKRVVGLRLGQRAADRQRFLIGRQAPPAMSPA